MAVGPPSPFVADADLHGLVDGHIEPDRRAETLRRLAASPADRARVEAWQAQSDLLRGTFGGVEREPLPILLDLTAKPRLQCIPANDSPLVQTVGGFSGRMPKRRRLAYVLVTALFAAGGVGTAWYALETARPDDVSAPVLARNAIEGALAARASAAVTDAMPAGGVSPGLQHLPTAEIPDLRTLGFRFVGADTEGAEPASIQFHYANAGKDILVISVADASRGDEPETAPIHAGNAYVWRKRDAGFALAGTLRPARLKAIAAALQSGDL